MGILTEDDEEPGWSHAAAFLLLSFYQACQGMGTVAVAQFDLKLRHYRYGSGTHGGRLRAENLGGEAERSVMLSPAARLGAAPSDRTGRLE